MNASTQAELEELRHMVWQLRDTLAAHQQNVFAGIIAERDRLLDEFSMALKKHGLRTSQRQVYPFDAAIERLVKQQVAAALEEAEQKASIHVHLRSQECTCCSRWFDALASLREGR